MNNIFTLFIILLLLNSCTSNNKNIKDKSDSWVKKEEIVNNKTNSNDIIKNGLEANITWSKELTFNWPWAFKYIHESSSTNFKRPWYFFLADNQWIRDNWITFSIPKDTKPWTYNLESISPFDIGIKFNVRLELWSTINYFNKNTKWTITFESIPQDEKKLKWSNIKWNYSFETNNKFGENVLVTWKFDFIIK